MKPRHPLRRPEIPPTVRLSHKPHRAPRPTRRATQRHRHPVPLRNEHRRSLVVPHPRRVPHPPVGNVRSQEHMEPQPGTPFLQSDPLHQTIPPGIRKNLLHQHITTRSIAIGDPKQRHSRLHQLRRRFSVPLLLRKKVLPIRDDERQVPRASLIDPRIVHLVDDPMAQGIPDPTLAPQRRPDPVLGARCPARFDARPTRRKQTAILSGRFVVQDQARRGVGGEVGSPIKSSPKRGSISHLFISPPGAAAPTIPTGVHFSASDPLDFRPQIRGPAMITRRAPRGRSRERGPASAR